MSDGINEKRTADINQKSSSNHFTNIGNQHDSTTHGEINTDSKEHNEDAIYDNMIFPS